MGNRTWIAVAALLMGSGCAWQGTPVPVAGDFEALAGTWEGTYSSDQSGRSGSILFKLDAATDSAFGDVWMESYQAQEVRLRDAPAGPSARPHTAEALRIAFVRAERGRVSGRLEAYQDPVTGERLLTVFEGRRRGDEFRGTYLTRNEASGRTLEGVWRVKRRSAAP